MEREKGGGGGRKRKREMIGGREINFEERQLTKEELNNGGK